MKIAVYTAVFGAKDILRPPLSYDEKDDIDYFVFTDEENTLIHPYIKIERPSAHGDVAKNARHYKILGDEDLKSYNMVIWHDANIQMQHKELKTLIAQSQETFLTTFIHPNRNDYYSEAMSCIRVNKDFSLRILRQTLFNFVDGMPAHKGMYSTGILIKNYKYDSKGLLELWWNQTLKHSRRDQLSLAYAIFKTKSKVTVLTDNIFDNAYSKYHSHLYDHYKERYGVMKYNSVFFKKISFYLVKLMRKIKKGVG